MMFSTFFFFLAVPVKHFLIGNCVYSLNLTHQLTHFLCLQTLIRVYSVSRHVCLVLVFPSHQRCRCPLFNPVYLTVLCSQTALYYFFSAGFMKERQIWHFSSNCCPALTSTHETKHHITFIYFNLVYLGSLQKLSWQRLPWPCVLLKEQKMTKTGPK